MAVYKDERGNTVSTTETDKVVRTTAVRSRQGLLGKPVLIVLIAGMVLAAVAWMVAGQYGEAIDNDAATTESPAVEGNAVVTPPDQTVIDNTPPAGTKTETAPVDRDPTPENSTGGGAQSVAPAGTEKTQ